MDDKILATSSYNKKTFWFIPLLNVFLIIGALISFLVALIKCDEDQYLWVLMTKTGNYYSKPSIIEYGGCWLAILFVILVIAGIIVRKLAKKCSLTVTENRIFGITAFKKQVDLPIDSISAISKSVFSGLSVATSSGYIKFIAIKNREEIYECLLKLITQRQNNRNIATQAVEASNHSNIDDLVKYKELMDKGVITQEEFEAKKKQMLGL